MVFVALAVIIFYGSGSYGHAYFLESLVKGYVEEKALALDIPRILSSSQLADVNSLFSGSGGDGSTASPAPSTDATTIGESALLSATPPDDDYLDRVTGRRAAVAEYIVQDGDLLSFIASDYGVTQASIIWANKLKDADSLSLGQVLRIPPVTGVIHKTVTGDTATSLAKKYGADAERIIAYNRLPQDGAIAAGDEIIIPDGKITAVAVSGTAARASTAAKSPFSRLPNLGDYFLKPTTGYITRGGAIHGRNGIDIANSVPGTAILAAADGIVTVADAVCEKKGYKCNGGYGYYIKVSHPNGTETLYAHASKLLVSAGEAVSKGQRIAIMGSTGNSTGTHLHFEVHGAKNPLARQ